MAAENKNNKRRSSESEPISARIIQAIILTVGVILLISVFFGGRWGPAITGGLIFATAFKPICKTVDHWLFGKKNPAGAKQACQIRMILGSVLTIISLAGVFI